MREEMPLPTKRRALELGASFLEADLGKMRIAARERDAKADGYRVCPITHCLEHDVMKAAEWASAAATLRALAAQEPQR